VKAIGGNARDTAAKVLLITRIDSFFGRMVCKFPATGIFAKPIFTPTLLSRSPLIDEDREHDEMQSRKIDNFNSRLPFMKISRGTIQAPTVSYLSASLQRG